MKIAIVNPRMFLKAYKFFPLSLGYIAAALEREKIPFTFYDLHIHWLSPEKLIRQLKQAPSCDLFLLTGLLTSFQNVQELAKVLKKAYPSSKIALGGRITVMEPAFIMEEIPVDYVVRGEGEKAVIDLVQCVSKNTLPEHVPGISYKLPDGSVVDGGFTEPVKEINNYHIPWHRFDMDRYVKLCNIQSPNVPSINLLSSRGCPFSCTFCNNSKGQKPPMRYYDIFDIERTLDHLKEAYGLRHVTFNDDIFTVNRFRMEEMCRVLKERNLSFSISTRLDFLDQESIALLDDSGCHYLCVGIESPSPTVAKIIDKRLNLEKYQSNIDALKKSRIVVNYGFIFGYLGETEQTIQETREFVLKNRILYSAFFANAFPQTKLYDMIRHRIPDEKEYLRKLFTVDLSKDYLVNLTDIPREKLYRLRDTLVVDSMLHAMGDGLPCKRILRPLGLLYLAFMRKYGLNTAFFKILF